MRRLLQIFRHMHRIQKRCVIVGACYMSLLIVALMASPTNATFNSETTVRGQMVMQGDFEKGSDKPHGEERDDVYDEKGVGETDDPEEEKGDQTDDDPGSVNEDRENEK